MPKIAEIEPTPNPNARKFILKEPLSWGIARSYDNVADAAADPLAAAIFEVAHVTNVFYVDHWITVTQDGHADWQELLREVAKPIREAPAAQAQSEAHAAADPLDDPSLNDENRLKLHSIMDLLDDRVRPFLQQDGGDLHVVSFDGRELRVHYQGACGSCPSSLSGTLTGIEGLVREVDPEIVVIPV
jgi:Fe-S cluster biogenesis protein NfuA